MLFGVEKMGIVIVVIQLTCMNIKKVIALLPVIFLSSVFVVSAEQFSFYRNLRLGMVGEDVRQLQILLNKDAETTIADEGIGSPGQESTYFGILTQKAVIRYQEKYGDIILKPNGLAYGTGYVGQSTRDFLANKYNQASKSSLPTNQTISTNTISKNNNVIGSMNTPYSVATSTGKYMGNISNYENIDIFFSALEKVYKKRGFSDESLRLVKEQIYSGLATSTDLKKEFLRIVKKDSVSLKKNKSLFSTYFDRIKAKISDNFIGKKVLAAGGTPFGGAVTFTFLCACSDTWLITLEPLPPSFPVLLSYIPGTQAYLSYNIPFTPWLLGEYEPGSGICLLPGSPCTSANSEGLILPMVGSQ